MKKAIATMLLVAVLCTGAYLGSSILRSYGQRAQAQENRQTLPIFTFQGLAGHAFELGDLTAGQPTLDQMELLEGGGYWGGFACGMAIVGTAALFSNPITGTAAAMGGGFVVGTLIGSCAGLLSIGK
jgi:hypothetical protein